MNFFQRRRVRKQIKHLLHEARHARHMRLDVAQPAELEALRQSAAALEDAWKRGEPEKALDGHADRLVAQVQKVMPPRKGAKIRENLEIFAVAIAVAMGFRTYFIQPFKIPTGSMQPTLYGITVMPDAKDLGDVFPLNVLRLAVFGERYVEYRAKVSGAVDQRVDYIDDTYRIYIQGVPHKMPNNPACWRIRPGASFVRQGDLLAEGRRRSGDHIFVNKMSYNFRPPKRGDIFVFTTTGITYPRIRPDTHYIKRLAGLPNETVRLDPPYLVADGKRITEPYPFERLVRDQASGYIGYQLPRPDPDAPIVLGSREARLSLGPTEYLPLGDNTAQSLDGRYFGAVDRQYVVGPAFAVYWPMSRRWGMVQ